MLLSSISLALTRLGQRLGRWTPLALWPNGIATPGMWISPRDLTSQWADHTGTTPVSVPGTVADSANPVGLAYDLRAGTYALGSELLTNGDFSDGKTGWIEALAAGSTFTVSGGEATLTRDTGYAIATQNAFTPGKQYEYTVEIVSISGTVSLTNNAGLYYASFTTPGIKTVRFTHQIGTTAAVFFGVDTDGGSVVFDNVSAKEILGNHMLQSTSAARPLLSARVNLLTYTEDFAASDWSGKQFMTVDSDAIPPPSGFTSVDKLIGTADAQTHRLLKSSVVGLATVSWVVKSAELRRCALLLGSPFAGAWFDSTSGTCGVLTDYPDTVDQSIEDLGGGFYRCSVTSNVTASNGNGVQFILMPDGATSFAASGVAMDGLGLYATGAQFNYGGATDYQPILTDGSSYSSTGFPIAQLYDGVDDGMATAAFSAGTLTSGMDCMVVVRRDSAAGVQVLGLWTDANSWFAAPDATDSAQVCYNGCGTPTVWVDGVQLAGGTAVKRDTLANALTVGDWHIMEFRDIDTSLWTSVKFGNYPGALFPGPRGDILLYPSTASTEDKDAARQWLADYYGVTLP